MNRRTMEAALSRPFSSVSSHEANLMRTSTVTGGPEGDVKSVEPGIDIFRRQPDGSWKIMRYMAYSREP
jgi:hypothetical protein